MQLENLTAQVRPRLAWEAVDLGFLMLQRWYRPVIAGWLSFTLPVFVLINVLLYDHPFLAALAFWWLLPVFDRIPLHILSRALFGEAVSGGYLLRHWAGIFVPHFIKVLTLYRLDFARSYNLPVWQLERLKGRARADRARVLKKAHIGTAFGLTFMCLAIEFVLFFSLLGLVMMLLPDQYDTKLAAHLAAENVWWSGPLLNTFLYLTITTVEPFYVAGGFSLYINRRTELEGWDIEIAFRQLVQRISPRLNPVMLMLCAVATLPIIAFSHPSAAMAEETVQDATVAQYAISNQAARKAIDEIMASPAFQHKKMVAGWYKKDEQKNPQKTDSGGFRFNWFGLHALGNALAQSAQLLLWVAIAALVAVAIYLFIRWMPASRAEARQKRRAAPPKSLFGLDITPESLPDDVTAAALALWQAGNTVDALSLLYRGALAILVHREGINLRGSATEGDCIRVIAGQAERIAEPTRQFFQQLTRSWQYAAYAQRWPQERLMRELCESWGRHFGAMQ